VVPRHRKGDALDQHTGNGVQDSVPATGEPGHKGHRQQVKDSQEISGPVRISTTPTNRTTMLLETSTKGWESLASFLAEITWNIGTSSDGAVRR
jgi:hypothetical protein